MPKCKRITNKRVKQDDKNIHNGRKDILKLGAGDSFYIANFIKSKHKKDEIFKNLLKEIDFVQMVSFTNNWTEVTPIPRMVGAQTSKTSDSSAIYRMPGCNQHNIDTENWTPTVEEVIKLAREETGEKLNHCVCTLYRDKDDSLAFHTDKILDLDENTNVLSISFGDTRPIVFQEIKGKDKQTVMLQSGSLLAIGPKTNRRYKHSIPKVMNDVNPRISLSVRTIKTFINDKTGTISGKGSEYQDNNYPFTVSAGTRENYTPEILESIEKITFESNMKLSKLRESYI
tara:strand:- start:646 stop:1503 length:858 start_codon:yes stop_codon:yes gene_type:complete